MIFMVFSNTENAHSLIVPLDGVKYDILNSTQDFKHYIFLKDVRQYYIM